MHHKCLACAYDKHQLFIAFMFINPATNILLHGVTAICLLASHVSFSEVTDQDEVASYNVGTVTHLVSLYLRIRTNKI